MNRLWTIMRKEFFHIWRDARTLRMRRPLTCSTISDNPSVLDWFGNSRSAIFALCWIIIWREIGFSMLIFLAELDKVEVDAYEAALIDGASEFQMMRYISFPYLKGVAKMYTVTMTIYVLNNLFGVVLVSTHGGPGFATTVMEYFIYFLSFRAGKVGLGTAVAVLLFLITMVLVFIYMRAFSRKKTASRTPRFSVFPSAAP